MRSFAVDPRDGRVYFSTADGAIQRYRPGSGRVEPYPQVHLRRDIFGRWDFHKPGHQGYNWRDILWHEESQAFYGVHPSSAWLFRFDPREGRVELIERICADDLRRSGHFQPYHYGYLTLQLGPDRRTLYHLTSTFAAMAEGGGAVEPAAHLVASGFRSTEGGQRILTLPDGRRIVETIHLTTYDLASRQYADHGVIRLEDGRYPRMAQCHAVHPSGRCFTAPWIGKDQPSAAGQPQWQCDLISFADPLARKGKSRP